MHTQIGHCRVKIELIFATKKHQEPKVRYFMAFSVYTNGRSLLSTKKSNSKDMMDCIHGIRVFSTQWVVLGHTYVLYMLMPTRNTLEFIQHVSKCLAFVSIK